jgi:hypothetical protein
VPTHVKYREHGDEIGFQGEVHGVRKDANNRSANAFVNYRKLERIVDESGEDGINLRFEADTEANPLALVSKRGLENLELGLGRDIEPPHSACGAEPGKEFVADFRPRARRGFATAMRSEALRNDLSMPVRDWHLLRVLGEVIPERLNVLELLIWRELLEAGGRNGGLRHISSIRPSGLRSSAAEAAMSLEGHAGVSMR